MVDPRAQAVADRWGATLGRTLVGGSQALVVEATTADGSPAVVKLQRPHRESEHEAAALARWDGDGAVRLLGHDPEHHALLLERCRPGTPLPPGAASVDVLAGLIRRLAVPAGAPFTSLADEAAHLARSLRRRRGLVDDALLDDALDALTTLPTDGGEPPVLLSQDLHAHNVLAAEREPWLAIDPKPLAGELAFAAVPVVRSSELGHSRVDVWRRLDQLGETLAVDRERARRWTIGHTLAWAFDDDGRVIDRHVDTVTWLHEPRRVGP